MASYAPSQLVLLTSRSLADDPERTIIGPIRYAVIEPLQRVRFQLEPNACQPIAFDWTFEAVVPPFLEERTHLRQHVRIMSEHVRSHQT